MIRYLKACKIIVVSFSFSLWSNFERISFFLYLNVCMIYPTGSSSYPYSTNSYSSCFIAAFLFFFYSFLLALRSLRRSSTSTCCLIGSSFSTSSFLSLSLSASSSLDSFKSLFSTFYYSFKSNFSCFSAEVSFFWRFEGS